MKRWIGLLALSLTIGVVLAWLVRPIELSFRWGEQSEQAATLTFSDQLAHADWTPAEEQAIAGVEATSRAFVAISKEVKPSVVTISSERIIETGGSAGRHPWGGMFPDGFFDRFFQMPDRIPQQGMGSGVIISEDGLVLTNNHVVANADRVRVTLADGRSFEAEVKGADPQSDVAVVQIDASGLPAARLGSSDALRVGEWVLAIGNPFQLTQTVTAGIVSAKGRSRVGLADYEDFIQTDAAINPGNSGGALVNLRGEVIGINTAIASRSGGSQGVGFAIPIDMAHKILDSLLEHGRVIRGYLGVSIQNLDAGLADNYGLDRPRGALVNSVQKGTAAEKAGIEPGDLILELNGKTLADRDDLRLQISGSPPGSEVKLTLLRDGKERKVDVRLGELQGNEIAGTGTKEDSSDLSLSKLGFDAEPINRTWSQRYGLEPDTEGLVVIHVEPGTPAADAGIREGDVILEAGRESIDSLSSLRNRLEEVEPGRTMLLKVQRQDSSLFLALRIPKS